MKICKQDKHFRSLNQALYATAVTKSLQNLTNLNAKLLKNNRENQQN